MKHTACEICWHGDVLCERLNRCENCAQEWARIRRAYDRLLQRFPSLRQFSIATIIERLADKALAAAGGR